MTSPHPGGTRPAQGRRSGLRAVWLVPNEESANAIDPDRPTAVEIRDGLVLRTGDVRATVVHTVPGGTETSADTISFARQGSGYVISGAVLGVAAA